MGIVSATIATIKFRFYEMHSSGTSFFEPFKKNVIDNFSLFILWFLIVIYLCFNLVNSYLLSFKLLKRNIKEVRRLASHPVLPYCKLLSP